MTSEVTEPAQNCAETVDWKECFLPASGGWVLLWFSMFLVLGFSKMVLADGAVARHIQTGLFIIQHHAIPKSNYVWAVNPNAPWLTHEFLGDLALGAAYLLGGLNGVALLGCAVIAVCIMWSYQLGRVKGLGPVSGGLLIFPVFLATSIHWLARSHIFSYLFFLIVYYLNFVSPASVKKKAVLTGLTMLLWTNFHGSMFIGIGLAALVPGCAVVEALFSRKKPIPWNGLLPPFLVPLVALIAGSINVRGAGFYLYIVNYLIHPEIAGKGGEWRVLDVSFGISVWSFLFLFATLVSLCIIAKRVPKLADAVLAIGLFAAGCWSMRLIPYFALVALPLMGPFVCTIRDHLIATSTGKPLLNIFRPLLSLDTAKQPLRPRQEWRGYCIKSLLFVALCSIYMLDKEEHISDFPDYKLPVHAMDYVQNNHVKGLAFSFDNWGPYINWRTNAPIFIDEKTDFYPVSFLDEYRAIYGAEANWQALLAKYNFTYAVLPPSAPLAHKLAQLPNWKQCQTNKTSVLFVRQQVAD